ncbi:DUF2188 domain-containing protein [Acholeplasma laidlawii]|uniref:DUF2188 domain-containing protein n=1 Tax=Acholeplasma laidlawii TaxID=2148 RepID=UPI0025401FE3|nr:DUF2188 domain-containing protein [Acholeplasma laidlawii]
MDFTDLFKGSLDTWALEEWLIIGLGALVVILILFLLLKPKKKKTLPYTEVKAVSKSELKVEPDKPAIKVEETPKEVKPEAPKANDKLKAEEKSVVKTQDKAAPKKASTPKEAPDEKEDKPATDTDKVVKYHVSQNKDEKSEFKNQWRVRKQGSQKTIKYFKTQAEAIAYAETLAENNDTSIVIHKRDGSIRKQDYTKKKSSN